MNLLAHNISLPGVNTAITLAFYFLNAYIIVELLKSRSRALKLVKSRLVLYAR
jgi:hypothetical protein